MTSAAFSIMTSDSQAMGRVGEVLIRTCSRAVVAVSNTRGIGKADMVLDDATPEIEVNPEAHEVRADGELPSCPPADVLPRLPILSLLPAWRNAASRGQA